MVVVKDKSNKLPRKHRITIHLNDKEMQVLNNYCKKYNIENRSQFIRETVFASMLVKIEEDYPSLFDTSTL